ncbi:putative transcriptional regulator [Lachnospiraceae bacterium PF1-21]
MNEPKLNLTKSENSLMNIFWNANTPLTSVEIVNEHSTHEWNDSYIHKLLRSLQEKGVIKVSGTVQYGTQYARQFVATCSREEYAAKIALDTGINPNNIAKVAVAMVEQTGNTDKVINILEDIVNSLKE